LLSCHKSRWAHINILERVYSDNHLVVPVARPRERSRNVDLKFRLIIKSIVVKCLSIQLRDIKEWTPNVSNDVDVRRWPTLLLHITFLTLENHVQESQSERLCKPAAL
jgi:hypothetical protein